MARILVPVNKRTYNHNPRGSATAVVSMRGRNPFEGSAPVLVHKGSAIPGMSGIDGLGADGATPTSATPSWMSNLLSSVVPLATSVGTTLVQNRMTTLYPPQTQSVQAQGAQMLPGQSGPNQLSTGPQSILVYPPAPAKSNMPMILIAVGVIGLGAAFMMSKKKRK